ncbi:TPA: tail fiber assembly protein [Aeromonas veronii]|uniref:tail fiber assembly protein n=1 Tax=Aeromonas TaxID=642 RepID=UPI0020B33C6A|nr:tail fiber assembly protein [Aeromonas sp. FDAARGOS 1404]
MMKNTQITFDKNGFATESGYLTAFIVNQNTMECLGSEQVWVSYGTGLPAGAFLNEPPQKTDGHAVIMTDAGWLVVEDHRGQVVYDTTTRIPEVVTELGPIQAGKTLLPPGSQFDNWNGDAWVKDEAAEQQAKLQAAQTEQSAKIANANQQIAILKPAVDGGYAKPEHTQLLADWQRYRYELTLVPEQTGWPESPQWPHEPEKVI